MPYYNNRRDSEIMGLTALETGSAEGLIEAAEKQGQSDLINSKDLPKDMRGVTRKEVEEGTGILFGDDVNDLFVTAVLPAGWSKKGSDHDMWSHLIDDKGRERASIFYKAAFYDRAAHMGFSSFWKVKTDYVDDGVIASAESVNGDQPVKFGPFKSMYSDEANEAHDKCRAWLDENYPDWRSPFAYWD